MGHSKDSTVFQIAAWKRRWGHLPKLSTLRAWAGDGSGAVCVLCEVPIEAGQIEYEVELRTGRDTDLLRFHELCYRLCSET